jgi:HK97 family phage prohead protease
MVYFASEVILEHKQIPVSQVTGVDPVDGIVEAIVSVTNIVDNVNDIILPNAYKATLRKRNPKVVWSHDTNVPVGKTLKVEELLPGDSRLPADLLAKNAGALLVKMQFNLNTSRGRDAYGDVQFFGSEQEWSIGYSVPEGKSMVDESTGIRKISQLELYEYSPVIFGAAPSTRTLSKDDLVELEEKELEEEYEFKAPPERYSDLDFSIPQGVKEQATTGLKWSKEYSRGGTAVGKNTANYLISNETADWKKVFHISAYFARHENEMSLPSNSDPSADGYPGNGIIAWKLWGGNPGKTWSQKLVKAMQSRDEENDVSVVRGPGGTVARVEEKVEISSAVEKRLRTLVQEHNEKYGDNPAKKVTYAALASVFRRGVGAYYTNPSSVRPSVNSPEQWAYGRVSGFLYALRNGRFRNVPYDTDLLPEAHSLSTRGEKAGHMQDESERLKDEDTQSPESEAQMLEGLAEMQEMGVNSRQYAMYDFYEKLVEEFGKFDQTALANGAHYVSENPFAESGMKCSNCVFYKGGQGCEIVSGVIGPEAICKLWVINEQLIAEGKSEIVEEEKSLELDMELKGPTPSHSTAVNDTDTWVDTTQYKRMRSPADPSYYKKIFGYRYPEKDGTMKTHYTFVHHFVSADGTPGAAAWGAITNSMSVLNGARTGTRLRGAERKAVYNHFKRHYMDHGRDAPELKSDFEIDEIMIKKGIIDAPLTKEEDYTHATEGTSPND